MEAPTTGPPPRPPSEIPYVTFQGLLRSHWLDWLQLVCGVAIFGLLQLPQPFKRYIDKFTLEDVAYPHGSDTVPSYAVPIIALLLPMTFFLGVYILQRKKADLHHSILGLCTAVMLTGLITDSLKLAIGRPRPDFLFRCFPSGEPIFATNGNVICNGLKKVIKEGRKSFPSGHSSWSFAGLGYLSLYMAAKMKVFSGHEGKTAPMLLSFLPLAGATAVAITRIDDYMHHWTDVVTGAVIGLGCAFLIYRQHFPQLKETVADVYPSTYVGVEVLPTHADVETGGLPKVDGSGPSPTRNS